MSKQTYQVLASTLNFLGGGVLCWDTLRVRRNLREKAGAQKIARILDLLASKVTLTDEKGNPLNTEQAIDQWLAGRTFTLGWLGFVLMTLGFLVDLVLKLQD